MRNPVVAYVAVLCSGMACLAEDAHRPIGAVSPVQPNTIAVQLSGPLSTVFVVRSDADPASQSSDVAAQELKLATITAGGTTVHLDWSRSPKIGDELLWWSHPRAGDSRGPHAEVTGQMVFKPFKVLDQFAVPAVSPETRIPVVVVESIKGYLAGPDGKPRGPQPDRERVKAAENVLPRK